jgi:hypothetical protein
VLLPIRTVPKIIPIASGKKVLEMIFIASNEKVLESVSEK